MGKDPVTLQKAADAELLQQNEAQQRGAPQDKAPAGPVPQACAEPYHCQCQDCAGLAPAAAAQRDIQVIPEPGAQGDVPAAVKFAHRAGGVGQVKVAGHRQAQQLSQAHGHKGVAGKVEIQLQAVAHCAQPGQGCREVFIADAFYRRPQRCQLVGQQHLAAKAHNKVLQAVQNILPSDDPLLQRAAPIAPAQDGPHGQLGKSQGEGGVVYDISLRLLAPVHIYQVAHALKEVEAHTQRQSNPGQGDRLAGQAVPVLQEEGGIFEIHQAQQVRHQGRSQQGFAQSPAPPGHEPGQAVVQQNNGAQQQRVLRPRAPKIEQCAAQHQARVFKPKGKQIISREKQRQKIKQKLQIRKAHGETPILHIFGSDFIAPAPDSISIISDNEPSFNAIWVTIRILFCNRMPAAGPA